MEKIFAQLALNPFIHGTSKTRSITSFDLHILKSTSYANGVKLILHPIIPSKACLVKVPA